MGEYIRAALRGLYIFIFTVLCSYSAYAATCTPEQYIEDGFCHTCPANATCDGAEFTCVDGFYKTGSICTKCPIENSLCQGPDEASCKPGYYMTDTGMCSVCPTNASCAGGTETFYCNAGWFKYHTECQSCAEHVCEGEKLISCGDGYTYQYGFCVKCKDIWYCPAGTINSTITCQEGYFKSDYAQCSVCPAGYFCPRGESDYTNKYAYCAPGYYRAGNECVQCPDGVECPGKKPSDMTCSAGLYLHDNGQCLPYAPGDCGARPNCNAGCFDNGTICEQCAVENSTCSPDGEFTCLAGYYKNGDTCAVCPEYANCDDGRISCYDGYYLNNGVCSSCTYRNYCNNNTKYDCPALSADQIALKPGDTLTSFYELETADLPRTKITDCRASTIRGTEAHGTWYTGNCNYNTNIGKYDCTGSRFFESANDGYYLAKPAGNNIYYKLLQCTNGAENSYYTGPGAPDGNNCPWVCNDGYYRVGDICEVCPVGQICAGGHIICPAGMYADGPTCLMCPTGYTDNPNTGAQSVNECQIKCIGGTYLPTANSTECKNVGVGYWAAENYTNYGAVGVRNACSGGMTTIGYGVGANEAGDCGHKLHIGASTLYLRSEQKHSPSLRVLYQDKVYYGSAIADSDQPGLKIGRDGITYTIVNDMD